MSSDKDKEFSLDDFDDLEVSDEAPAVTETVADEGGFDLTMEEDEDNELKLSDEGDASAVSEVTSGDEFSFNSEDEESIDLNMIEDDADDMSLSDEAEVKEAQEPSQALSLSNEELGGDDLDFSLGGDEESLDFSEPTEVPESSQSLDLSSDLDLGDDLGPSFEAEVTAGKESELSDDALSKLREIDQMMQDPADQSLVSDDLDLESLNLSGPDNDILTPPIPEPKKVPATKKKKEVESYSSSDNDIRQIMGNHSGDMERLAATLSNLRTDREELLSRIQKLEEEKIFVQRQNLSFRAELDEKKIELMIIKKKLNDENNELKDRLKIQEEMKLIWEEKNRQLHFEVEKISQKTRLDVRKVQGRERELEQKLELLKADAETQIRHRDQKILELKRRVDGMEFDMESMGHQEKKSLDGKVELEQKLDKAIRTLRGAISILENDSEAAQVLEKLKKNIEV